MPTEVDKTSVFDTILPNVYIKKVSILPATTAGSKLGLEYDPAAFDRLETNRYGKKKVNQPSIDFDNMPNTSHGIIVNVELVLKDMINQSGNPHWFGREELAKYLKLRVVLVKRKQLTEDLLDRNFRPSYLERARVQNQFIENVIDLRKFVDGSLESQKSIMIDGQEAYDISYTTSFYLQNENPKNIAIFAHTFKNLNEVLQDKFILSSQRRTNYLQSPVSVQYVIKDGSLVDEAFVYKLPDGKVWAGPVHQHSNGSYMAGAFHTAEDHPSLTREKVSNFIIEDYRVLEDIDKEMLALHPYRKNDDPLEPQKTSEDTRIIRSEAYITEPDFSSDSENVVKFLFHLDHHKIVRDNTQFGEVLKVVDDTAKAKIMENSPIKDLSVYRERVTRGIVRGEVIPVDFQERTELIANTSEKRAGSLRRSTVQRSLINTEIKSEKVTVGAIRQINLSVNDNSGIRSIGVTDYDMARKTDGLYRYYIEAEIGDGTIPFVKEQLTNLNKAKKMLQSHYEIASLPENTVAETGQFTYEFVTRQQQQYDIPSEQELLNNNLIERSTIVEQSIASSPWVNAITTYFDVLSNLTSIEYRKAKMAAVLLHNLCSPSSGSLYGLDIMMGLLLSLESKIKNILNRTEPEVDEVDFSSRTASFKGKLPRDSFRLKKSFSKIHNSNVQNNVGYDFLVGSRRKSIGPRQLTTDQFQRRMEQESEKYFAPGSFIPTATPEGTESPQFETVAPELSNTFYSYLAPGIVYIGKKNTLKTLSKGPDLFLPDKYNSIISNILKSNSSLGSTVKDLTDNIDPTQPEYSVGPIAVLGSNYKDSNRKISKEAFETNMSNLLILDTFNVTISSKESYEAKAVLKDSQDGLERNLSYTVDPREVLGQSTKFATDPIEVEELLVSEDLEVIGIEEQKDLTGVSNTIIKSIVESVDSVFSKKRDKAKIIEDMLLENETNIIDKHFSDMPDSEEKKQTFLNDLPLQIKSLVYTTQSSSRKDWFATKEDTGRDLLATPEFFGLLYFLYNHINKIEVLIGFSETKSKDKMISKPIFRRLTSARFQEIRDRNLTALCRMVPYRNNTLGFKKSPKLKLPEFDSVFLLRPRQSDQQEESDTSVAVTQTANDFVEPSQRSEESYQRMMQTSSLNTTGKRLMEEILTFITRQDNIPPEFSNTTTILQPRDVVRAGTRFSSRGQINSPLTDVDALSRAQNQVLRNRVSPSALPRRTRNGYSTTGPNDEAPFANPDLPRRSTVRSRGYTTDPSEDHDH